MINYDSHCILSFQELKQADGWVTSTHDLNWPSVDTHEEIKSVGNR